MPRYAEFTKVALQTADENKDRKVHINPAHVVSFEPSGANSKQTEINLITGKVFVDQDMLEVSERLVIAFNRS